MELTQAEYDALSNDNKKLFKKDGDNWTSATKAADDDDTSGLKSALQKERDEVKRLKQEQKDREAAATKDNEERLKREGSIADLELSWKQKMDTAITEKDVTIQKRDAALHKLLAESHADSLAREISTVPKVMKDQLLKRITVEYDDTGEPKTRVLDAAGKISALTLEDLKKEVLADKDFSPILIGSRASGGGAGRGGSGTGGFRLEDYQNEDKSVNWSKVNRDRATNPDIVTQITESLNPPAGQDA
jgi:hypothetical protein